jgi:flagellar assembly protein FliH
VKAELAEETARLRALAASLEDALAQGIAGMEDAMVEIAFAAACKVLGQAAASEDGARAMVHEAMRQVRAKEGLVLRVSPADHEFLAARVPPADGKVELAADERVAAGGCLIETSGGTLDARLEVQLRQLLDTLLRARETQGE